MKITKKNLHDWWSKNTTVRYHKKLYKVHKMSYGDYFLEPVDSSTYGEQDGFHPDTEWFYHKGKGIYGLESNRTEALAFTTV